MLSLIIPYPTLAHTVSAGDASSSHALPLPSASWRRFEYGHTAPWYLAWYRRPWQATLGS